MSPTGRSPIPSCLSLPLAKSNENDRGGSGPDLHTGGSFGLGNPRVSFIEI